jgi:hypothetical protein
MSRKNHRSAASQAAPSRRQRRVGELSLHAGALLSALVSSPAYAEVCDKAVGDNWLPSHGPVWLLNPVGFPFGLTIFLAGLLAVAFFRLRWVGYLAGTLLLLLAAISVSVDLIPQHDSYLATLREGCASLLTDWMNVGLVGAFAVAYVWLGHRARHSELQEPG